METIISNHKFNQTQVHSGHVRLKATCGRKVVLKFAKALETCDPNALECRSGFPEITVMDEK